MDRESRSQSRRRRRRSAADATAAGITSPWAPPSPEAGRRLYERWCRQQAELEPFFPAWAIGLGAAAWAHAPGPHPERTATLGRLVGADGLLPTADLAVITARLGREPSGFSWAVCLERVIETVTGTSAGLDLGPPLWRGLGLKSVRLRHRVLRYRDEGGLFQAACSLAAWLALLVVRPPWDAIWREVCYRPGPDRFAELKDSAYAELALGSDRSWLGEECTIDPARPEAVLLPWPPSEAVRARGLGDARLTRTLVRVSDDQPLGGTVVPDEGGGITHEPDLLGWWLALPVD